MKGIGSILRCSLLDPVRSVLWNEDSKKTARYEQDFSSNGPWCSCRRSTTRGRAERLYRHESPSSRLKPTGRSWQVSLELFKLTLRTFWKEASASVPQCSTDFERLVTDPWKYYRKYKFPFIWKGAIDGIMEPESERDASIVFLSAYKMSKKET